MLILGEDPGLHHWGWALVGGNPITAPNTLPVAGVLASGIIPAINRVTGAEVLQFHQALSSFTRYYNPTAVVIERFSARLGPGAARKKLLEPINVMIGAALCSHRDGPAAREVEIVLASTWKVWLKRYVNQWGPYKVGFYNDGETTETKGWQAGRKRQIIRVENGLCPWLPNDHEACAAAMAFWLGWQELPVWKSVPQSTRGDFVLQDWRQDATQLERWLR
jgi:hypothetical protein